MTAPKALPDKSSLSARLNELISRIPPAEQQTLLEELEERSSRFKRMSYRRPLRTAVKYGTQYNTFQDLTKDISAEGVFIETRMPFRNGEDISLTFALPTSPPSNIRVEGQIARISPQGIGVRFKPLNSEEKRLIKSYVEMI